MRKIREQEGLPKFHGNLRTSTCKSNGSRVVFPWFQISFHSGELRVSMELTSIPGMRTESGPSYNKILRGKRLLVRENDFLFFLRCKKKALRMQKRRKKCKGMQKLRRWNIKIRLYEKKCYCKWQKEEKKNSVL